MVVVTPWQAWLIQSVFYLSLYQNENNCLAKDELCYIENFFIKVALLGCDLFFVLFECLNV